MNITLVWGLWTTRYAGTVDNGIWFWFQVDRVETWSLCWSMCPVGLGHHWSPIWWFSARHQPKLKDGGHRAVCCMVCLFTPQLILVPNYTAWLLRQCMWTTLLIYYLCNYCPRVILDSASAGLEPAISSRKSKALNNCASKPHSRVGQRE